MRISDWSSDVCSSDLRAAAIEQAVQVDVDHAPPAIERIFVHRRRRPGDARRADENIDLAERGGAGGGGSLDRGGIGDVERLDIARADRSEEHTSELQSLMRNSYAVFRLKKKRTHNRTRPTTEP